MLNNKLKMMFNEINLSKSLINSFWNDICRKCHLKITIVAGDNLYHLIHSNARLLC